jgi:2'-5' RNA ligase
MFIGSNYALTASAEGRTVLGFPHLQIAERVLSRTETRRKKDALFVEVTSYHYTLLCIGGFSTTNIESVEIAEETLQSEIIAGYYELVPERAQL